MSTELSSIPETPPVGVQHVETNTCPGTVRVPADRLLQLSRRIDWRFLFPNPNLESVLYIGAADQNLIDALKSFSKSLCVADSVSEVQEAGEQFDVAVLQNPSQELLQQVSQLIYPGGMLYLEINKRSTLAESVEFLSRHNFLNVQTHWHWPNFESCTSIIPTNDKATLGYFLSKPKKGIRGTLLSLTAKAMFHCGLSHRLFHNVSVTAQRGGEA